MAYGMNLNKFILNGLLIRDATAKDDLTCLCLDNLISSHVYTTRIHLIFFSTVILTPPKSRRFLSLTLPVLND